jgi:hypothetical protein
VKTVTHGEVRIGGTIAGVVTLHLEAWILGEDVSRAFAHLESDDVL